MLGLLIEMLGCYVFLLPLFVILEVAFCRYYKKKGIKVGIGFAIGWQVLALYFCGVYELTGVGGIYNLFQENYKFDPSAINLIPIVNWGLADMFGFIMNILMFVPLGIMLPVLWKNGTKFWATVLCGFSCSLLIELSQLTNMRATDVDDLITNTLGVMIGYGIYKLCLRKLTVFQIDNSTSTKCMKNTATITCMVILLMFIFVGSFIMSKFGYEIIAKLLFA